MNPYQSKHVPVELINTILLFLPTKTLVRFLCVCKTWRDLIQNPVFIKNHSWHRANSIDNSYILYAPERPLPNSTFRILCEKKLELFQEIAFPFDSVVSTRLRIVGSFNGLLCLAFMNHYETTIYLYNPSIRKHKMIHFPIHGIPRINQGNFSFGFGYHDQTNDYKVVRTVFLGWEDVVTNKIKYRVEVYSLNTNSCRIIELKILSWGILDVTSGVCVNDSVHWRAIRGNSYEREFIILAFHLEREVFEEISMPNYVIDNPNFSEYIGVFKEKLSVFVFNPLNYNHPPWEQNDLWVMMEYGDESSWTKMYSIRLGATHACNFTKNDQIILEDEEMDVFLCHFETNHIAYLDIKKEYQMNFVSYMDSLVLLDRDMN
ncbi:F-box/kelch-repeat protein [Forsythia ovata]|uniref:F-box/kelch-repeat protein n=1 Tax=Forsythia ovata TaxID=205694 RepID=A0ABD1PYT4_9LAMI